MEVVCQQTLSTPVHFTEHQAVPSFQSNRLTIFFHKLAFHQLPYDTNIETCYHRRFVFSAPLKT